MFCITSTSSCWMETTTPKNDPGIPGYFSLSWALRGTHQFDVLSVRWRYHLWGETLRRFQAFSQPLIDEMKRQGKLLSGQFPDVANVTKFPEKTNRRSLHQSNDLHLRQQLLLIALTLCAVVIEDNTQESLNGTKANQINIHTMWLVRTHCSALITLPQY